MMAIAHVEHDTIFTIWYDNKMMMMIFVLNRYDDDDYFTKPVKPFKVISNGHR